MSPLDSTGYLSPTSYGEKDILFHRPTATEQEQANSSQSVRARRTVDEDGEVLLRAADILEQRGWCQYEQESPDGRLCLYGAIFTARHGSAMPEQERSNDDGWNRDAHTLGFPSAGAAVSWNNAEDRTAAEVIARLRSAAEQEA